MIVLLWLWNNSVIDMKVNHVSMNYNSCCEMYHLYVLLLYLSKVFIAKVLTDADNCTSW